MYFTKQSYFIDVFPHQHIQTCFVLFKDYIIDLTNCLWMDILIDSSSLYIVSSHTGTLDGSGWVLGNISPKSLQFSSIRIVQDKNRLLKAVWLGWQVDLRTGGQDYRGLKSRAILLGLVVKADFSEQDLVKPIPEDLPREWDGAERRRTEL